LLSRFFSRDGIPLRYIDEKDKPQVEFIHSKLWTNKQLHQTINQVARQPFKLAQKPLLRIKIFERESKSILLFVIHHIIIDLWSLALLLKELDAFYASELSGQKLQLRPINRSNLDFVQSEKSLLASLRGKQMDSFWSDQVKQFSNIAIYKDFPDKTQHQQKKQDFIYRQVISLDLSQSVIEYSRGEKNV